MKMRKGIKGKFVEILNFPQSVLLRNKKFSHSFEFLSVFMIIENEIASEINRESISSDVICGGNCLKHDFYIATDNLGEGKSEYFCLHASAFLRAKSELKVCRGKSLAYKSKSLVGKFRQMFCALNQH